MKPFTLGLAALVATILWMFAVAYFERETLIATGISAAYTVTLVTFAPAALRKPWVQIASALPIMVVAGAVGACAFWAFFILL